MKRKITIAAILAAAMLLQSAAFADISISKGVIDREFSESRTLYYVQITTDNIPDVSIEGYETVSKAVTPYTGGALTEENTTVLKNKSTGKRYRFVFEQNKGTLSVSSCELTAEGELEIKFDADNLKNVKLFILKPTAEFSDEAFKLTDIEADNMEKTVLDVVNFESGKKITYTFSKKAKSGRYRFVITADGLEQEYNETKYYMSKTDINEVLETMNKKCKFNEENTAEKLQEYVDSHKNALYLDCKYYDDMSDDAQLIAIKELETTEDYKTLDEIGERFYKGVAIAGIYDGLSVKDILGDYNKYLNLELFEEYSELEETTFVDKAVKGIDNEDDLRETFNKKTAIACFNEAEPSDMEKVFEKYNSYIGVDDDLYDYFMKNSSKCIKKMRGNTYSDTEDIEEAIKAVKNSGSSGGSSGGVSSKVPSGGGGSLAPITETKPVTEKTPETENKAPENKLPFVDIEDFDWAYTAIEHLYNNKILSGKSETRFVPEANITREEFAKLVVVAFGLEGECELNFKDVEEDKWYTPYIKAAVANEIVNGVSEDEFGVGRNITREDMAVMILRAVVKTGINTDIIIENPAELSDLETVSDYAREAVEFMIKKGAINGINGEFKPKNEATRAQAAKILYQIIKIR